MTDSLFTRVNAATERTIGRAVSSTIIHRGLGQLNALPGTLDGSTNPLNSGVAVSPDAVTVFVDFSPRIKTGRTTAIVTLDPDDYDAATTYSVTINGGTARTTTGSPTVAAAAQALADEINDNEDETAVTVDFDLDGVRESVMIFHTTAFTLSAFGATGGGGTMTASVDMDAGATINIWLKPKDRPGHWTEAPWFKAASGSIALEADDYPTERFNAARYSRVYIQITGAAKPSGTAAAAEAHCWLAISEAISEGDV